MPSSPAVAIEDIEVAGLYWRHRDSIIPNYPSDVQRALEREYVQIAGPKPTYSDDDRQSSWAHANRQLSRRDRQLKQAHAGIAFDEHSIAIKAKTGAELCLRRLALPAMEALCLSEGIQPPDQNKHTETGRINRMRCEKWWRRQLHRYYSRRAEGELRDMGLVNRKRGLYCSDATLNRRWEQKRRQREMMREVIAINDLGDQLTLFDLAKASVSNPAIRRAELMTRISGFEGVATLADHAAEFYTFTTPSRFHAYHSNGERNAKHVEQLTPRDAQRWLRLQWSRIRAKLRRLSIRVYGFRVAEPHHDGTTHWHLLLFMRREHADTVREVCRAYLLSDEGSEPGAQRHRFVAVAIDAAKGTAAGYIAKYVAKNIDGFDVGHDFESESSDAKDTAARVDAWASTWGIRQFQQIGGPPVGLWRELRRIRSAVTGGGAEALERARKAADAGEWAAFVAAFGGIEVGQRGALELAKELTGECNEYGELKAAAVIGIECGLLFVATRLRVWVFAFVWQCAPWTRVNNCTLHRHDHLLQNHKTGPP